METKNVVIAMVCASIVILSIATPISAIELENSGVSGEIDGTGEVTGSVSIDASTDRNGEAEIEASIEASVELVGPGSAECSQEGPVTHTVETELGTIVADVSEDSSVNAAVAVVGDGSASADAYVGTTASLGVSEVEIRSEISARTHVDTDGGSASATASATGTTTGDGISYATGDATNDATSHAEVSGNTEANAAVSGTARASSYAAVGSTDYAGHNDVTETSYIGSGSYAWGDDGSQASADSSANGEAYQDGQAENCASSATYAEGEVSTAVATQGNASAHSYSDIWSYNYAYKDTDEAYVEEYSGIYARSRADSGTSGKASAESSADGDTGAAGSACGCVFLDTSAIGKVSTAVQTEGDAYAYTSSDIESYGEAYKDNDVAYVDEDSEIRTHTYANSDTDGKASADSTSIGYTGAAGSACGCVYSDTSAIGIVSTAVQTQGPAYARSSSDIWSYGWAEKGTDYAYVEEYSDIWTSSRADSGTDGKASADSASIGYTGAAGSACGCVYSDTSAIGIVSTAVHTEGDAYARSSSDIWSYGNASKDTAGAYVEEFSDIRTSTHADSGTDGKASAGSDSIGYTGAAGSACGCVFLDTSAIGIGSTAVQTEGPAYASSYSDIEAYGEAEKDTDGAYVDEDSEIWTHSYADSDTDGKASAGSSSIGYTDAAGSACNCVFLDTSAIGIGSTAVQTEGPAYAWSGSDIESYGEAYKDNDSAYVNEHSNIWTHSDADSDTDGKASAGSSSIGYTDAAGSACGCVFSDTSAIGIGSTAVQTEGPAYAHSSNDIWSYGEAEKDTDGAYVYEHSEIDTWSDANSDTDGKASAGSSSKGYTGAAGSACNCVFLDTSAIGIGSTAVQTEGPANAWSDSDIESYGWAEKDTDGAYVEESSYIGGGSDAGSDTDGKASAGSASKGYTGAAGSACDCADSWTNAKGAVQVNTETDGDAWITAYARLTSDGWIVIGKQMGANSVINTGATAMHNSNSAGTATADGSTEAGASDSCTNEGVGTGILDGKGDTVVNPFDVMKTNIYAGFAYANAIPDGFEAIVFDVYIDTSGPNEAYSSIDAIAVIPAPAP